MATRILNVTLTLDGVTPAGPLFAGYAGDDAATVVNVTLPAGVSPATARLHTRFIDGMGTEHTGTCTAGGTSVQISLPKAWTVAGGDAALQIVAETVNMMTGAVTATQYLPPIRLYFRGRPEDVV